FSAGSNGLIDHSIHVAYIQQETDGRAAEALGTPVLHLRNLIGQHDAGIADLNFGVTDLAVGLTHAKDFLGSESLFVKFDGRRGAVDDQIRRHGVIAIRDWFYFGWHCSSYLAFCQKWAPAGERTWCCTQSRP